VDSISVHLSPVDLAAAEKTVLGDVGHEDNGLHDALNGVGTQPFSEAETLDVLDIEGRSSHAVR
jgi:hypothetical protein